jgi:hypothetical protein
MLLCGTAKAPPRQPSGLTLEELVDVITWDRGEVLLRR